MSSNIIFVPPHDPHHPARRVRSRKACDFCRNKKRRCFHQDKSSGGRGVSSVRQRQNNNASYPRPSTATSDERELDLPRTPSQLGVTLDTGDRGRHVSPERSNLATSSVGFSPARAQQRGQTRRDSEHQSTLASAPSASTVAPIVRQPSPQFVGDLDPHARLLGDTTSPEETYDATAGEVGTWVQPRASDTHSPHVPRPPQQGPSSHISPPVSDLVPMETIEALSDLYFTSIHPIIPLLDKEEYLQSLQQSIIPMPLVHVVCLLAAKHHEAASHLHLFQSGNTTVSVRQFCSQVHASIVTELSRRTNIRKITLVRIMGLLSLHHEGSDGAEQASSFISQAMHTAQSMALHQPRPQQGNAVLKRTFWCLWTLDRLNAAIHSRPCNMADIDIAVEDMTTDESESKAFDIWFRIAKILNRVIGLYRPRNQYSLPVPDLDFPGFEAIVDDVQAWDLSRSTIATLHTFYLATAILAHRLKAISTLPSPTQSRLRQQLSAIQIIRSMQNQERLNTMEPLPVTVYAVSLALSVSYQQLRYSRLPSDQDDARQDFHAATNILQQLRRKWEAADLMADLAHRISVALDSLPTLDVLHVDRRNSSDRGRTPGRTEHAEVVNGNRGADANGHLDNHPPGTPGFLQSLDVMDLFGGMDDVSWMYLDAENPISLDNFPPMHAHAE